MWLWVLTFVRMTGLRETTLCLRHAGFVPASTVPPHQPCRVCRTAGAGTGPVDSERFQSIEYAPHGEGRGPIGKADVTMD